MKPQIGGFVDQIGIVATGLGILQGRFITHREIAQMNGFSGNFRAIRGKRQHVSGFVEATPLLVEGMHFSIVGQQDRNFACCFHFDGRVIEDAGGQDWWEIGGDWYSYLNAYGIVVEI